MKVLLVNGSPHKNGCTYTALCEVSKAPNENGVDTDIFWIGNKPRIWNSGTLGWRRRCNHIIYGQGILR